MNVVRAEWLRDRLNFVFSPDIIICGWLGSKHQIFYVPRRLWGYYLIRTLLSALLRNNGLFPRGDVSSGDNIPRGPYHRSERPRCDQIVLYQMALGGLGCFKYVPRNASKNRNCGAFPSCVRAIVGLSQRKYTVFESALIQASFQEKHTHFYDGVRLIPSTAVMCVSNFFLATLRGYFHL